MAKTAWVASAKETAEMQMLGAQLSVLIEAERQKLLKQVVEQASDLSASKALHEALVGFREGVLREVGAALDRGTTAAHDALARAYLKRWMAGETRFTLASGRQEFDVLELPKEQIAEVERLAAITEIKSYEFHWEQLGGEHSRWHSLTKLKIDAWEGTCKWHNEESRFGGSDSEHWVQLFGQSGDEIRLDEIAEQWVQTTLDESAFAVFFYLVAFDYLDEHRTPYPRPSLGDLLG